MIYKTDDLLDWDSRKRTNLLNKISGYKSAHLLGTKSPEGKSNLATVNTVIHVGANPFLLAYLSRPLTIERHSYNNILKTGQFSLNQIHTDIIQQAHQCSAKYPAGVSEFEQVGFEEYYLPDSFAPCVKESRIKILLDLQEIVPVKSNATVLVIGKVKQFEINHIEPDDQGHIELDKIDTIAISGLDSYYACQHLHTLPYAKP